MNAKPCLLPSAAILAVALAACSSAPELVFRDWLFDVPEGTPIKEYGPVPLEGRDATTVQLIDDLVIGGNVSKPDAVLYEPGEIVATEDGTIFVADRGSQDIKMFAADGTYLKTLGSEGQGPGEFGFIGDLTIAGDRLVALDARNRRFSIWSLAGEHIADYAEEGSRSAVYTQGLADATLIWYFTERDEDRSGRRILVRSTLQGEELARLHTMPMPPPLRVAANEAESVIRSMLASLDDARMIVQVGGGEVAYLTPGIDYQILALTPDGEALWALRVAWPLLPWPEGQKQPLVDSFVKSFPTLGELDADALDWPAHAPALAALLTDGAGRLHAVIYPDGMGMEPPDEWPVDVYSPTGERIASGTIPYRWSYARGDYVYGTRPDDDDETVVVRYRLLVNEH